MKKYNCFILVFLLLLTVSLFLVGHVSGQTTGASFSLQSSKTSYQTTEEITVQVMMQSDTDAVNVVSGQINFPANNLQIVRIDTAGSFISLWTDTFFDNTNGKVSLIGSVPNPGFKTSGNSVLFATLVFKAIAGGSSTISFDNTSQILRGSDNTNILSTSVNINLSVTDITIFENGFEGGVVNNNFVGWDGTTLEGAGSITAEPTIKTDGQYSALFNAPNGSSLRLVDRAFSYKQFTFPVGNVLWAKTKFRFEGAGTSLQFGGGFLIQFNTNSGYYSNRWNVEFYSPSQVFDRPNNTAYPFTINGTADAGTPRIHQNEHTFVEPDTWYEVKMKIDYSGTNPTGTYWITGPGIPGGTYTNSLVDTSVLSVNATKPTFVQVGAPWWDQATREKLYIDQVGLYSADPDINAMPTPTLTPTLTPTPPPIPCTLSSAFWSTSTATESSNVKLNIEASGDCSGKQVNLEVRRNIALQPDQPTSNPPVPNPVDLIIGANTATSSATWKAEWVNSCLLTICDPQYFFKANIVGDTTTIESIPRLLTVTSTSGGTPTPTPVPGNPNDWPQVQKDAQHTGYSAEVLGTNIKVAWTYPFQPDRVHPGTQAIVYQGKVFVGTEGANGQKPTLYAIDATAGQVNSGKVVWRFEVGGPILNSVAADNGKVFVASMDGAVYAVDSSNGQQVWKKDLTTDLGFSAAPIIADSKVLIGGHDGKFYALNPIDGAVLWSYDIGTPILMTAAYNKGNDDIGRVFFGGMDMYVYALNTSPSNPNDLNSILSWKSQKIAGMAFKDYWPVIHQGKVVIVPLVNSLNAGVVPGFPFGWRPNDSNMWTWLGQWGSTIAAGNLTQVPDAMNAQETAMANYQANPANYIQNLVILDEINGQQTVVPNWNAQTLSGAHTPPCVDRDNNLIVPVLFSRSGWARLNLTQGRITDLLYDGYATNGQLATSTNTNVAGFGNADENLNPTCAANMVLSMHFQEGNANYTGAFNLDTRRWIAIGAGQRSSQMSNVLEGRTDPASISNGMLYHISWHELIARTTN